MMVSDEKFRFYHHSGIQLVCLARGLNCCQDQLFYSSKREKKAQKKDKSKKEGKKERKKERKKE